MKEEKIAQQLSDILPNRPTASGIPDIDMSKLVEKEAEKIKIKADAKELARLKYIEKQKLKKEQQKLKALEERQEKRQALADELGLDKIPDGQTEFQARKIAEKQKQIEAIEAIEAETVEPLSVVNAFDKTPRGRYSTASVKRALQLQGASRPEMTKLLTSLNINLSVQLSKQDTANLLACLLTCNHSQLQALAANKKVPVAIKTVIKRLMDDEKLGNIETIEKLWDRIFGKGPMQLSLPESQQLQTGIIPNQPVSREAYLIIRDTLIK